MFYVLPYWVGLPGLIVLARREPKHVYLVPR